MPAVIVYADVVAVHCPAQGQCNPGPLCSLVLHWPLCSIGQPGLAKSAMLSGAYDDWGGHWEDRAAEELAEAGGQRTGTRHRGEGGGTLRIETVEVGGKTYSQVHTCE